MSDQKNYIPAVLPSGNHKAKITSFELRERPFKTKAGNSIIDLVLNLETEPIGGNFKGLKKDSTNPASEVYLGQVARVKYSEWGFSDGMTPGGNKIEGDKEILKSLKSLCIEIGQLKWFQDLDEKLPTVAEAVKAVNESGHFKDHYLYWCLASRQYVNKNNYATDDLYLPKYSKEAGKPFSKKMDDLIKYNSTNHLMKPKNAPANTGTAQPKADPGQTSMEMNTADNLGKSNEFIDNNDDLPF